MPILITWSLWREPETPGHLCVWLGLAWSCGIRMVSQNDQLKAKWYNPSQVWPQTVCQTHSWPQQVLWMFTISILAMKNDLDDWCKLFYQYCSRLIDSYTKDVYCLLQTESTKNNQISFISYRQEDAANYSLSRRSMCSLSRMPFFVDNKYIPFLCHHSVNAKKLQPLTNIYPFNGPF